MSALATAPAARGSSERVAGSFRDPSGYVFQRGGRVFRAVDGPGYALIEGLFQSGTLPEMVRERLVVDTAIVDEPELLAALRAENPGFRYFLSHARVPLISYPYEWSLSMLADAAVCTLKVQRRLLTAGLALKDATAYNIQFVDGRPVFIDLTSIEKPSRLDIWYALGQFQRMFLYPLVLARAYGWDLRSYFLASLDGRGIDQIARSLRPLDRFRPSMLVDFTLPILLDRQSGRLDGSGSGSEVLEKRKTDPGPQLLNLDRLQRKVEGLAAGHRPKGVWADYTRTCTYDETAEGRKKALVREFLAPSRSKVVLDLGCNIGDYSLLAAETGARVIAADGDHDAIELLYRRLRQCPAPISPLVLDLSNPSPAIGYMNRERASFFERGQADCVLALALIHHLLVSGNLSLEAIRDMFCALTRKGLILEFVPTSDPMFQRLMRFRVDLFADLDLAKCKAVFAERFEIVREVPVEGSLRTLLLMNKRAEP